MRKLLLSFVAMIIGATSLFAEEKVVTITGEDALWGTARGAHSGEKDGVTIAVGDGLLSKTDATGQYRAYKGQAFSVSVAEGNITGIEVTCTANGTAQYGPGCFTAAVGTYSYEGKIGTWTGSAEKVDLVASSAQVRMTLIKVTYEVGAPAPEATSLALSEASPVNTAYYVGDAFSTEGLVATATFADASTKDVTEAATWTCEPAVIAEDTKAVVVTASYKGLTASKTYNVTVKSIANTAETAYTVEEAVALIDAGKGLNAEVYVKGIISKVASFNEKYGSITYYISTDGTEGAQQFMCYSGLNIGGEKFASAEDVEIGARVVVKGTIKKYNDDYEFNYNNELVSYVMDGTAPVAVSLALSEASAVQTEYFAGETFSIEGLVATATFDDESAKDVTGSVTWTFEPATIAEDTKAVVVTASYKGLTASKTYDITVKSLANTAETAYTVEEAVALINAGKGLDAVVFVKGIISKVLSFNEKYGSISYFISSDGTEESQQFECYGGLNIGGEKFASKDDLEVGSSVVVKGKLKKFNTTYELDLNNEIVSMVSVGIDNVASEGKVAEGKLLENGKVVVLKAGKKYTVAGQRVK